MRFMKITLNSQIPTNKQQLLQNQNLLGCEAVYRHSPTYSDIYVPEGPAQVEFYARG